MAGPESPPVTFARTGFRLAMSMRIPTSVLMRQRPSAPSPSHARATSAMSATLGESFMKTGLPVTPRTAFVMAAADSGDEPKLRPPQWTFGQEILTSRMETASLTARRSQFEAYSSGEKPPTFAMIGPSKWARSHGSSSLRTASMPRFSNPTAFSIPDGVSAILGSGLPMRGSLVIPFTEIAPRTLRS